MAHKKDAKSIWFKLVLWSAVVHLEKLDLGSKGC